MRPCSHPTAAPPVDAGGGEVPSDKPYAGTTIYIIGETVPPMDYVAELLPLFEEETGIKVEFEQAPYEQVVEKETLDLSSKTGNYDVISTPYEFLGSYVENGFIQPIDPFLARPELVGDDFDQEDLIQGMWDFVGDVERPALRVHLQHLDPHAVLPQGPVREPGRDGRLQGQVRLRPEGPCHLG